MIYFSEKEQFYLNLWDPNVIIPINIGLSWMKKVSDGGREMNFEDYKRFERYWEANI